MEDNMEDGDLGSDLMQYRSDDHAGLLSVDCNTSVETAGPLSMFEMDADLVGGGGNPQ